jgi:hypothetical protein
MEVSINGKRSIASHHISLYMAATGHALLAFFAGKTWKLLTGGVPSGRNGASTERIFVKDLLWLLSTITQSISTLQLGKCGGCCKQAYFSSEAGLPDFSWYLIPKVEKCTK